MRGFTIIEILIVVGMVAIIAAAVFLSLSAFRAGQDLRIAGRGAIALLRDAQSRAISQEDGNFWGVRFSHDTNNMTLWSGVTCVYGSAISSIKLKHNLEFLDPATSSKDICFDKISGYSSASGDVIIKLGVIGNVNETRTITIYKNGRIE